MMVSGSEEEMVMGGLAAGCAAWGLVINMVGLVVYVVLAAGGAYVLTGGLAFKELRELDKVRKCMIAAAVIPLLGILTNGVTTLMTLSVCGIIFATMFQLLPLGLGIAAAVLGNNVLSDPAVSDAFES